MGASEFDIIRRYFTPASSRGDVVAGVGDDAALLAVPAGHELAACMDTLVAGVHFPAETPAEAVGHKALAVNLSDLAAMGAEPAWATLSLTLPAVDEGWLAAFSRGFLALAAQYRVQLVGGDLSRGPLSVTVQAHGFVPAGRAARRAGGNPGDLVGVTGTLGDAGLALHLGPGCAAPLQRRLDYPQPRVAAGLALRGRVTAMIDISDGLLADLGHLLETGSAGAVIDVDTLPRSAAFRQAVAEHGEAPGRDLALAAGDDYELCFCIPGSRWAAAADALAAIDCAVTAIGRLDAGPGIRCRLADGSPYTPAGSGYRHFDGAG